MERASDSLGKRATSVFVPPADGKRVSMKPHVVNMGPTRVVNIKPDTQHSKDEPTSLPPNTALSPGPSSRSSPERGSLAALSGSSSSPPNLRDTLLYSLSSPPPATAHRLGGGLKQQGSIPIAKMLEALQRGKKEQGRSLGAQSSSSSDSTEALKARLRDLEGQIADRELRKKVEEAEARLKELDADSGGSPGATDEYKSTAAHGGRSRSSPLLDRLSSVAASQHPTDSARLASFCRRVDDGSISGLSQEDLDYLSIIMGGGLTSTKVSPSTHSRTSSSPSYTRGLADLFRAAWGRGDFSSKEDLEAFQLEQTSIRLKKSRESELAKALKSLKSFMEFLKKRNLIGATPYGRAGALLCQQILELQVKYSGLEDSWTAISLYLEALFKSCASETEDESIYDLIMEGWDRLTRDKTDIAKTLDPDAVKVMTEGLDIVRDTKQRALEKSLKETREAVKKARSRTDNGDGRGKGQKQQPSPDKKGKQQQQQGANKKKQAPQGDAEGGDDE